MAMIAQVNKIGFIFIFNFLEIQKIIYYTFMRTESIDDDWRSNRLFKNTKLDSKAILFLLKK